MSSLIKNYTRRCDKQQISCLFSNNKNLLLNTIFKYHNGHDVIPDLEHIIAVLQYDNWSIEVHNERIILNNNILNILLYNSQVYIGFNTKVNSIITNLKENTILLSTDNYYGFITDPFVHNNTYIFNNLAINKINNKIQLIYNGIKIITITDQCFKFDNLSCFYSITSNEDNVKSFYLSYKDNIICNDKIFFYYDSYDYSFSSDNNDPSLVVCKQQNNIKIIHNLSYTDTKEEYYFINFLSNKLHILIADLSFLTKNNNFIFNLSFLQDDNIDTPTDKFTKFYKFKINNDNKLLVYIIDKFIDITADIDFLNISSILNNNNRITELAKQIMTDDTEEIIRREQQILTVINRLET